MSPAFSTGWCAPPTGLRADSGCQEVSGIVYENPYACGMNLAWGALHAGLQSVLDTALDAVVVMDVRGNIIGWNDHAATNFGWTAEEAHGQRLSDLIVPPAFRE